VSACHSLNGLDEDEIWRNVGVLYGGDTAAPYQQTVTTACHHCVEPGCLEGCPVMAYDKDAETGIVRHLDDQCIGCQYCVLKCPYDVPKYSAKRGIVRKCDMCSSRLAVGEAPACVQACPTQAIRIDVIETEQFERDLRPGEVLVPGAFDSHYTKPTTRYRTTKPMPANTQPGDAHALRLEHAHWPLIFMLVLTQMSVGTVLTLAIFSFATSPVIGVTLGVGSFAVLQAGLAVSVLHLGRPLGAWRFFLGLRTSWMSREILAFGVLAAASAACAGAGLAGWLGPRWEMGMLLWVGKWTPLLAWFTALLGLGAVWCSAMIYIDTRRSFWRAAMTVPKFFGTTLLLGVTLAACLLGWAVVVAAPALATAARSCAIAATLIRTALFAWESTGFLRALRDPADPNHRPARTIWTLRRVAALARPALFVTSTVFGLFAITHGGWAAAIAATLACATTTASQLIERYFYFTAVVAPRMPGGVAA
jgi:Fe-S-cluster-containing dehydrogenase component/DMSO reductase anchor subunit